MADNVALQPISPSTKKWIVVSALTDEENVEKIMKMGAIDFIKKPIDLQYLVDKVEATLQNAYDPQ